MIAMKYSILKNRTCKNRWTIPQIILLNSESSLSDFRFKFLKFPINQCKQGSSFIY